MSTKNCAKCNIEKPLSEFHNFKRAKDGKQSYCKKCKSELSREGHDPKYIGKYVVYYIPSDKYVGMTYNINKRISQHKSQHNRDVSNYRILLSTRSKWVAHMTETFLHMVGFNGFRY